MINYSGRVVRGTWKEISNDLEYVLQNKGTGKILVKNGNVAPASTEGSLEVNGGSTITSATLSGHVWATALDGEQLIAYAIGDATSSSSEALGSSLAITNAIPDAESAADLFTQWGNFSGVNMANGDFVTYVAGLNGQSITALSASPLTTGESYVVNYSKAVQQPCSMEFAGSFVRGGGIGFATASLFANDPVNGADPVPDPINIVSYYQSSADYGNSNTAVAGTVLTLNLENPLPSVGSNQAVFTGDWVNITGLVDNRFNYPNACISFIDATRKIICIKYSDESSLPSALSPATGVTTPTLGTAKVNFYNNFSGARNAFGLRFTGATATSASVMSIFGGDDNQVSGTLLGDHRVTVSTTAPTYVAGGSQGQYEIKAGSRYRFECTPDVSLLLDKAEQVQALWTPRDTPRTSVKPSSNALLYPRFRLFKPASMSRPIAKIVKAEKLTAITTATITTDVPHGLVTGNWVTIKGIRDQVNFGNISVPVQITYGSATTFTVTCGAAAITTSYGGSVILCNGGKDQPGWIANTIQSVVSRVADGSNWLEVVGVATWSGVNLGDYIDLHGVRNSINGADLGLDGAWEITNLNGTTITVKPVYNITGTRISPALGTLTSTNCGGIVILRQTLRAHDLAVSSWKDIKVSIDGAGTSRLDKSIPVVLNGGFVAQGIPGTVSATSGLGGWYVQPAVAGIADIASAAITASTTSAAISNNLGNGFQVNVTVPTAPTGTNPTLDVRIEESFDGGTNWVTLYEMQRIIGAGSYNTPILRASGRHIRYVQTVGGTTPSFTRAFVRNVLPFIQAEPQKRLMDRTIVLTTLNSVTPVLFSGAANNIQLILNLGTATTPPTIQLEGSEDGVNFYSIGAPLTGVASSTVQLTLNGLSATFVRARVSTVGATVVAGYVSIKAWS